MRAHVIFGEQRTPGDCRRVLELLRAARAEFGRLPWADRRVIVAAALGEVADFTGETPGYVEAWERAVAWERLAARLNDSFRRQRPDVWIKLPDFPRPVPSVTVRPEVVRWLLTDEGALKWVHAVGVKFRAARCCEPLMFAGCGVQRPFMCFLCDLNGVLLHEALCATIRLQGCLLRSSANSDGPPQPLAGDGLRVKGGVFLDNWCRAEGEVRLVGAEISGQFACMNSGFINPLGHAIAADGSTFGGDVILGGSFRAEGEVRLGGATLSRDLFCSEGTFINHGKDALSADGMQVGGTVILNECRADGAVRLLDARIQGNLECKGGKFLNPQQYALSAGGVQVGGEVALRDGFRAEGEVELLGARIARDLACTGGEFINPGGKALNADQVEVGGSVYLRDEFRAVGEVRLIGARITSQLMCVQGSFVNPGNTALRAQAAEVTGTLILRGMREVRGEIDLTRCRVGYLADGYVEPRKDESKGNDSEKDKPKKDEDFPWPEQIILTGFRYDAIFPGSPMGVKERLKWLEHHDRTHAKWRPKDPPDPQPYRQLAEVLKKQGHEEDGRRNLHAFAKRQAKAKRRIAREKRQYVRAAFGLLRSVVFNGTVGYGYCRWRALWWLVGLTVIGAVVFGCQNGRHMQPVQVLALQVIESAVMPRPQVECGEAGAELVARYPKFNALVYSADALIPLVSFHQEEFWTPRSWWTKLYLVFHIAAGWVIATLFAVSFTKLMRPE